MPERDLLTDIVLLTLFFLLLYTVTYIATHYPEVSSFISELLSSKAVRATLALIALPVSIVFITLGIRLMLGFIVGKGRLALGFILIAVGVAMFLYAISTVIGLVSEVISRFIKSFTQVQPS